MVILFPDTLGFPDIFYFIYVSMGDDDLDFYDFWYSTLFKLSLEDINC